MALSSRRTWLNRLSERLLGGRPKAGRKQTRRKTPPLLVEPLEDRTLPAGTWTPLANLAPSPAGQFGRHVGTMLLQTDGTIMVQGGDSVPTWYKLTPNASGSYINGTWTQLASMSIGRLYYGSAVLPNGDVFVVGGEYTGPGATIFNAGVDNTAEIYNPLTNTWSAAATFPQTEFADDPVEVMANGTILGGYLAGPETFIYDPASNTWTPAGTKLRSDQSDEEAWVKLPDGSILSYDIFASINSGLPGSAQRYIPSTDTWVNAGTVPVSLSSGAVGDELGPALLLPNGKVFQVGANSNTVLYDPSTNTWTAGPTIPNGQGADDAPGAILPDGHVIFGADTPLFSSDANLYDYDPTANTITQMTLPAALNSVLHNNPSFIDRMLVLPNGDLLLGDGTTQLWEYNPNTAPTAGSQPTITSVVSNGGNAFTMTGTQLNGISEGSSYGDDVVEAENYPIVQLTANYTAGPQVIDARTTGWVSQVATGAPVTTQFTVPAAAPHAAYLITVSATGISSTSGVLYLDMGAGFNNVTLRLNPGNNSQLQVLENGVVTETFAASSISSIMAIGNDATNDTLKLDFSNGNFMPAGGLSYDGGTGNNTLVGPGVTNTWNVTGTNSGDLDGNVTFSNVQNLVGGAGNDTFNLATGGSVSTIHGGAGGNDTIVGPNATDTWNVTGANSGNLNGAMTFTNVGNLVGGTAADTFKFAAVGSLSGGVDGGGIFAGPDKLDYSAVAGAAYTLTGIGPAHGYKGSATALAAFKNIDVVTGVSTLLGTNTANVWDITGVNSGTVTEAGLGTFAFSGIANLVGGNLTDQFNFHPSGSEVSINGGAGVDTLDYSLVANASYTVSGSGSTDGFAGSAASLGAFQNIDAFAGLSILVGTNTANVWNITGLNSGSVLEGAFTYNFTGITQVVGGNSTDHFNLTAAGSVSAIDGGAGVNTLTGPNTSNTWHIAGGDSGDLNGITFTRVGNLVGNAADDTFAFAAGGSVSGSIDGGGAAPGPDTLDYSGFPGASYSVTGSGPAHGFQGSATALPAFQNIDAFTGFSAFAGGNTGNVWNITGVNSGTVTEAGVGTFAFSGEANLVGGTGSDTFIFHPGGSEGSIDGGGGAGPDTLDYSLVAGASYGVAGHGSAHGFSGFATSLGSYTNIDTFTGLSILVGTNTANVWNITGAGSGSVIEGGTFTYNFTGITKVVGGTSTDRFNIAGGSVSTIDGGTGSNSIAGSIGFNTWIVTGTNSGDLNGTIAFTNVQNLLGGLGANVFAFGVGGSLSGGLDGGAVAGSGTLDYSAVAGASYSVAAAGPAHGYQGSATGLASYKNIDTFTGLSILVGTNTANVWNITGAGSGSVTEGGTFTYNFTGITKVVGGTSTDLFNVASGGSVSTIDGGGGSDTVTGPNAANTWNVTGADSGNLNGTIAFTNVGNLLGGTGADTFKFTAAGLLDGGIDGGGTTAGPDALDYTAMPIAIYTVTGTGPAHGFQGYATALAAFQNIDLFVGFAALAGPNTANVWNITGVNSGSVTEGGAFTYNFTGIADLIGGTASDDFIFHAGGSEASIDGGGTAAGPDTLDYTLVAGATYSVTGSGPAHGFAGSATSLPAFQNIDAFAGFSSLTATNTANVWNITGVNSGALTEGAFTFAFSGFAHLIGGTLSDDFIFHPGGSEGSVDGGGTSAGPDTLDYSFVPGASYSVTGTGPAHGFAGSATALGSFQNIDAFAGLSILTGTNTGNVWNITGVNSGSVTEGGAFTYAFTNIANLVGGTGTDQFIFHPGGSEASVNGGGTSAGPDSLDYSLVAGASYSVANFGPAHGFQGSATNLGSYRNIDLFAGLNILVGTNTSNVWQIGGLNSGSVTEGGFFTYVFHGAVKLVGGSLQDTFFVHAGAFEAAIDGGGGGNYLVGPDQPAVWDVAGAVGDIRGVVGIFSHVQNLYGGAGGNLFEFGSTSVTFVVNGGRGGDVFAVLNPTGIAAPLYVNGFSQLVLSDRAAAGPRLITITANSVGTGPADSFFGAGGFLVYTNVVSLTFLGGAFGNTINLGGQAPGTLLTLAMGGGNDLVNVFLSPVTGFSNLLIDGEGGGNAVSVIDLTGGAVIKNLPSGAGTGEIDACYAIGPENVIDYVNVGSVFDPQTPDQSFVQALYHKFLLRDGAPGEINGWAGYLAVTGNRAAVVDAIARSPEAYTVMVVGWYQRYLGRTPGPGEVTTWVSQLVAGVAEETVLTSLLGSGEFYARGGGTDAGFINELFQVGLGRAPVPSEMAIVEQSVFARVGPGGTAFAVISSSEYRADFVGGLFVSELERAPSSANEVLGLVFSNLDMNGLREALAASLEFYIRVC